MSTATALEAAVRCANPRGLADRWAGTCPCGTTTRYARTEEAAADKLSAHVKRAHPDSYATLVIRRTATTTEKD